MFPIRSIEQYEALFRGVSNEKAIGEASPQYLESRYAKKQIKETIPDIKLIASLRNPVDRAYSLYQMEVRAGKETRPFLEALKSRHPNILGVPYYENIKSYLEEYSKDRLKIILFDDLKTDPTYTMKSLFHFLEVDEYDIPSIHERHNVGGIPKSAVLQRLFTPQNKRIINTLKSTLPASLRVVYKKCKQANLKKAPPLSPSIRVELAQYFRTDILKLQELIGRDLSTWLQQ